MRVRRVGVVWIVAVLVMSTVQRDLLQERPLGRHRTKDAEDELDGVHDFQSARCKLDDDAHGVPEGVVIRSPDRSRDAGGCRKP